MGSHCRRYGQRERSWLGWGLCANGFPHNLSAVLILCHLCILLDLLQLGERNDIAVLRAMPDRLL